MFDFLNLKAKAEALQKNAKQAVEELEKVTVSERSADESVSVTLTGNGKMVEVEIDPSFCFPEKADALAKNLTDTLIRAQARAAVLKKQALDEATGGMLGQMGGGLDGLL
jgi:DNA-binding protein YbaB